MGDAASSFAFREEKQDSIGSGDIIAFCPEFKGFYISVHGAVVRRGDSEAAIEQQTVKDRGMACLLSKWAGQQGKDVTYRQSLSREEYGGVL